jgi:hypothetical protein
MVLRFILLILLSVCALTSWADDPENSNPEVSKPDADMSEVNYPEVRNPKADQPEISHPEVE